jgi:uncharacterized membrane protein
LFVLPALLTDSRASYEHAFAGGILVFVALLVAAVRSLRLRVVEAGRFLVRPELLVVVLVAILGSVALTRFDLVPATLTVATLAALGAERWRLGAAFLGAAIAVKLYPAVLLPVAIIYVARRAGRRKAATVAAIAFAVVTAAYAPFLVWLPGGVEASLRWQLFRPLEIESLGGSLFLAVHKVLSIHLPQQASYQEFPVRSADIVGTGSAVVGIIIIIGLWIRFAVAVPRLRNLVLYFAASVAAFVAFGKVFSPQYMLWLVPLVALVPGKRGLYSLAALTAACLLTAAVFPRHFNSLRYDLATRPLTAIVIRDLLIVCVLMMLVWPSSSSSRRIADAAP